MSEHQVQTEILLALSKDGCRLFRNNVGVARYYDRHGRKMRVVYGLCPGSSDLIGWRTVEIRPEDVGKKVAVFLAVEVKTESGRATRKQERFLDVVRDAGGLGGVARSEEEAFEVAEWS